MEEINFRQLCKNLKKRGLDGCLIVQVLKCRRWNDGRNYYGFIAK